MNNLKFIEDIEASVRKYASSFGICVHSPIIAQAILESTSGTSELATNANNFFGLKWRANRCPSASGHYIKVGSEQNPDGTYISSSMKWFKFPDLDAGVRGYFEFINVSNYAALKGVTDPETYLKNIKAAGYATSLKYVENLMNVIKKYDLTRFDDSEGVKMASVFLSAGHGGKDPGAVALGLKEKDINLQALLACKSELEARGVKVVCSRTTDEDDPLRDEVKEANSSGCDLAVSFHANAGGGDGFEAFCNTKNSDAVRLAKLAEKHVKALGQNSRGIKGGTRLGFIKNTTMTAVLFESFFVDNDVDNNIGDTIEEQKAFGRAYAAAILEYLGIAQSNAGAAESDEKKEDKETSTTANKKPYTVKIKASALNIRAGAGINHNTVGCFTDDPKMIAKNPKYYIPKGTFTIVEIVGDWGKLKSGIGWINLKYTEKV